MIMLREYKVEDWTSIQDAVEPFCALGGDIDVTTQGIAVTATDDDVMACGGICYIEDEGRAWMKMSAKCKDSAYTWARTIKEAFRLMIDSVDIPVHTYILKGFCDGERVARAIGMKRTDETEILDGNTYYKYVVN